MSFARFGYEDSGVYVIGSGKSGYQCCACGLLDKPVLFGNAQQIIDHLMKHREAGHVVPDSTLTELVEQAQQQQKQTVP